MDGIEIIIWLITGAICSVIASSKGRNPFGWFFVGFLISIIGIIIIACMSNLKTQRAKEARVDRENRRLREQLRQEQLKGEAFRQHATTRLDAHDGHLGLDTRNTLPSQGAAPQKLESFGSASLEAPSPSDDLSNLAQAQPGGVHNNDAFGQMPSNPPAQPVRMWHYESGGQSFGPVEQDRLITMLESGTLNANTLLWSDGLGDWQPAESISEFAPYLPL